MFDLGLQELIVIFAVALLVFGPKRLPELGRAIGKAVGQFKSMVSDVRTEVDRELHIADTGINIEDLPAWKKKGGTPDVQTEASKESPVTEHTETVEETIPEADENTAEETDNPDA